MAARASLDIARRQPAPIQTTAIPRSFEHNAAPPSFGPQSPFQGEGPPEAKESASPLKAGYQKFVLTDPVAFRYLAEDSCTSVLDRRRQIHGYECYIVEQWTTSRSHPTFMITTYTGDPSHTAIVDVLSVPTDERKWSPRLRVYFKALNQYHAQRRDTALGILMVTNLSGFPSSLTVIPVPDGDARKHRFDFFVNENLKRLGCSGRVGLSLSQPAITTTVKFHQLYRTSDKNDIYKAVPELVKLCQSALMLFNKLAIDYADGLLCDVTERAINDWWVEIGTEQYNLEPHDGILGPTTVAGLLGLLMGARNRLHSVNAPVSKDPFDVDAMKRGIGAFQKSQKMTPSRRLDRRTLDRLHKATQKAADRERWAVPKAVKSTVAELSGKGGEMVMDVVGRRDRAGIAEIETADIDRFVQLVYGDRAKWLWLGKQLKKTKTGDEGVPKEVQGEPHLQNGLVFKSDEHGGFTWTARHKSTAEGLTAADRREQKREEDDFLQSPSPEEGDESGDEAKLSMFKRASTLRDDAKSGARSGLGKVAGAVGLRGHKPKPSTDESASTSPLETGASRRRPLLRRAHSSPMGTPNSPGAQEKEALPLPIVVEQSGRLNDMLRRERAPTAESMSLMDVSRTDLTPGDGLQTSAYDHYQTVKGDIDPSRTVTATASLAGSENNSIKPNEGLQIDPESDSDVRNLLRRTTSYSHYIALQLQSHTDETFPRHLSFSLAEDSVLHIQSLIDDPTGHFHDSPAAQLANEELLAKEAKNLRSLISDLHTSTASWTSMQISQLRSVLSQCDHDQENIDTTQAPHLESMRELQMHSEAVLREARDGLEEGGKALETCAAKLEYEIEGLKSRVEDVAAGVGDYEKGVARVEERVKELEKAGERGGRWGCVIQ